MADPIRAVAAQSLTLEPQTAAHAAEMFAVLSDAAIYEYENAPPASLEGLRTRFGKLETRRSGDGREQWFNWVIRVPSSKLIGYVQATVREDAKRANSRSTRLLDRLGFTPGSEELRVRLRVEYDEVLMCRSRS